MTDEVTIFRHEGRIIPAFFYLHQRNCKSFYVDAEQKLTGDLVSDSVNLSRK
ncbi:MULTISPECIES: hypothetical protein [Citrobacter]|uniref:hypothetical protein n=1 Tax=Citrobacter TaxID=544 RepID=UPI000A517BAE|nr:MULTISPECIES: hypothetical protein [Citrobacter]MBA7794501.1 hypothetical protein [Citrobacter sp. RHBSTW-01065]MBJ9026877.1 hypothetical protein [Citrobacter braakii]MDM3360725.1 hypothetical protein [Citrobacter sp. Cb002]MDU1000638.1 hypothetical protein [Citrobacter sp.]MDU5156979.1 hypothetical protein [Citrobacter sp.]